MEKENLNVLKERLENLGFGRELFGELERHVSLGKKEFQLQKDLMVNRDHEPQADPMQVFVHVFKTPEDRYDLIYMATLPDAKDPAKNKNQIFYPAEDGITLKEGYNLLQGRAVYKPVRAERGDPEKAWLQLDFAERNGEGSYHVRQYGKEYDFDLEKALERFSIRELYDPLEKEDLIRNLERGNREPVTLQFGNELQRVSVEANPRYKTISIRPEYTFIQKMDVALERLRQSQGL